MTNSWDSFLQSSSFKSFLAGRMGNEEVLHQNFYQEYLQMKQCIFFYIWLAGVMMVLILCLRFLCALATKWRERGMWGERNCAAQLLLLPMGLSRCRWSPQVIINCFPYWAEIGLDNRWHFIARSCCCFFVTSLCNSERESFTGSRLPWKAQKKTRACDFLKQAFILSLFCTKCLASAILHLSETLVFMLFKVVNMQLMDCSSICSMWGFAFTVNKNLKAAYSFPLPFWLT